MTRDHDKTSGNWTTAQMPRLVHGQVLSDAPTSPDQKQREAAELRALVEEHLAAGGAYEILSGPLPHVSKTRA